MPKKKAKVPKLKHTHKTHLMLIGTVIIAVFVIIVSWSWLREVYYSYQTESAFSTQLNNLRDPLNTFGYKGINSVTSICKTEMIAQYSTAQLICESSLNKYVIIGNNQSAKNNFIAKAKELDQLLSKYGWTEDKNAAPTIANWFQEITSGKDYLTDEGAYRTGGGSSCSIDFFVAYSNPSPPAFNLEIGCNSPVLKKFANEVIF